MGGAMHKKMALALGACLALLIPVSSAAVPVSHTVGDATGWALPNSPSFYSSWASKESSFNVGDFLVFNFPGATQTVAEVTKSAYDSCSSVNPLTQVNNGPVNITITSPGPHYYISTDAGHCLTGQKFSITVASPTAPAPKSATPSGAMTPAASTPTATPAGKGAMTPAATPMAAPGSTAMSPATTPMAAPGSTAMSPATTPMEAPAMSPTGVPMSSISSPPATAPTAAASPPPAEGPGVSSPASDGIGEPGASSSSSASRTAALILLSVLLVVAPNLLF